MNSITISISDVLSLIAILISLWTWRRESRANKSAHEFDLFKEMYQNHLISRIPRARARITITSNGILQGEDALIQELNSIRKDSIYYMYAEADFYNELKEKLWAVEDFLTVIDQPILGERRENFELEMNTRLSKVYKCIIKRF